MRHRYLQAYGGELPDEVKVCFANTGKEREQLLASVNECSPALECPGDLVGVCTKCTGVGQDLWLLHCIAERRAADGRGYLPTSVARFYAAELKIRKVERYVRSSAWDH